MQRRADRILIVMVGLPARGKSFLARKICRYLRWLGHAARIFNVGSYRRERLGDHKPAAFFDPNNPEGSEARQLVADAALDDALRWLKTEGTVALYDATNSTRARRAHLLEQATRVDVRVLFVESICHDEGIVEANISETKLRSPDYVGVPADIALADFRRRIELYEQAYESVSDPLLSFVQVIDAGRQVVVNRVEGPLLARIVALLLNSRLTRRTIWLTRHGESVFNMRGRIGGNSVLSPRGEDYALALGRHFEPPPAGLVVWTSTLARAMATARHFLVPRTEWRQLDEIDAGVCDGMTYEEIARNSPELASARAADKLRFRYPQGESYLDVVRRLEPLILELERQTTPTLIVSHQAVLRALYAYLVGEPVEHCPHVAMPLHTLLELVPNAYGSDERRTLLTSRIEERPSMMPPSGA
ncbi:MAG: fructose-2,6-bisphosphatase [Myxococcales bacterium]|nr:fructose-2,6-bisphosphatase [Myxococcales bacterium]